MSRRLEGDPQRRSDALRAFGEFVEFPSAEGAQVQGVSLAPPSVAGGEWRAVVKVAHEGTRLVAFFYGETIEGVLEKVVREARNGKARWKNDEWAK